MIPCSMSRRRGFALSLVLWFIVGAAALATGFASVGRSALLASSNRRLLTRGLWAADGCIERLRAVADDTLLTPADAAERGWRSLDSVAAGSPILTDCALTFRPVGAALDINTASAPVLAMVLRAAGEGDASDSIANAIVARRDSMPFRAAEELHAAMSSAGAIALFDIEPGKLLVGRAPPILLATVPGFGPEAVARATTFSGADAPRNLLDFSTRLSPGARAELLAHFAEVEKRVTWSPDAWIVTSPALEGNPSIASYVEVKLVRAGRRAGVVRRRTWP